ncbi:transporter substrate-binding domain-containing protein [Thiomicrospira microaerophila]|uniref:transporter substrate-binding domain-containing protein n=1 Tax=Thiomicrospira microaerophila TaxID=406020 RepID=UPI0006988859|nr:transporter substrate-binding domain-containing protein [Thiomicrospira microaerophila]
MLKKTGMTIIIWLFNVTAFANQHIVLDLNPEERAFIVQNPIISMCVDPDWKPFEYLDQAGQHQGIGADLIRLVAQRVGLQLQPMQLTSWPESVAASKANACQVLSFINQTPARDNWLIFTDPLLHDPNVIITRQDQLFIPSLSTLRNKTLVLPRGTSIEERIRRDFPHIAIALVDTEQQSFAMVNDGRADLTLRSLSVAAYTIRKYGYFNLKVSGQVPEYTNQLRIGVTKDNPILRDILNKGIATITDQERAFITNQHIHIHVETARDYRMTWKVIIASLIILLISLFWIYWLIKLNRKLIKIAMKDPLTGLLNQEGIQRQIDQEIERTQYTRETFGIILIEVADIDKKNLLAIKNILINYTQKIDFVARWSTEEFMILCPCINAPKLKDQADMLYCEIKNINLADTFSFYMGATCYNNQESQETLISRAQQAVYLSNESAATGPSFIP